MIVEVDGVRSKAWATYTPGGSIVLHRTPKEALDTTYGKTIIGIDHEYLHHILYKLEGFPACKGLDKIIGRKSDLVNHCIWTGFNLSIEERGVLIYSNGVRYPKTFWKTVEYYLRNIAQDLLEFRRKQDGI